MEGGRNEARTLRPGIMKDFERAAAEAVWKPEQLRKIVTHRLATAVIEGRPSNVAREAELLGKMKEVDHFVRNADNRLVCSLHCSIPKQGRILARRTRRSQVTATEKEE
jgi:hypothetical protein